MGKPPYLSSKDEMDHAKAILDDSVKWPNVQLPADLVGLILVFEGGCIRAWQRDRIGVIYSNVYREFFGQHIGTVALQRTTNEKLLPYYCAFATYVLSKRPKVCRFARHGRFHRIERANKSRKYFRPWKELVRKYKLQYAITKYAHTTESPLIQYFSYASRRFAIRDLGRGMLYFRGAGT